MALFARCFLNRKGTIDFLSVADSAFTKVQYYSPLTPSEELDGGGKPVNLNCRRIVLPRIGSKLNGASYERRIEKEKVSHLA